MAFSKAKARKVVLNTGLVFISSMKQGEDIQKETKDKFLLSDIHYTIVLKESQEKS